MNKKITLLSIGFLIISLIPLNLSAVSDSIRMIIPKGQVTDKFFKVFIIGKQITKDMNPTLIFDRPKKNDTQDFKNIGLISSNQVLTEKVEGEEIEVKGTWIYFNISKIEIPRLYSTFRVIPVVKWQDNNSKEYELIYPDYYFIGHGFGAAFWTVLIVILILLIIIIRLIISDKRNQVIGIVLDEDGNMSMSLLQMWLWTIFIGSMTLAFGLLRLNVPEIPDTLIMLMLFAAGTTTAGQFQTKIKLKGQKHLDELYNKMGKNVKHRTEFDPNEKRGFWKIFGTVFYTNPNDDFPSIAKVQVLFWTLVTLVLFIYVSINEQRLWNVPSELVLLMGISQATFLGRQQMAIQEIKGEEKKLRENSDSSNGKENNDSNDNKAAYDDSKN